MIGQDHIRRLSTVLAGSSIVAVTDVDAERAKAVAAATPGARHHGSGLDLIRDASVDAVLVASWGPSHEDYCVAAIEAGKPVFCEKPLATTQDACVRIMEAEMSRGRRFVQVGFMRRYDASYRALKQAVTSGAIGTPLIMHSAHRNPSVPSHYTRRHGDRRHGRARHRRRPLAARRRRLSKPWSWHRVRRAAAWASPTP